MQVMPHICSQPGLFVMHIFRYLFLYCLILTFYPPVLCNVCIIIFLGWN